MAKAIILKEIQGVLFEFNFDYDPAIKEMYACTYEVTTIELMRTFLSRGGIFIDVGANIGYLSAVALGLVGKTGSVHAFEPVPEYFQHLENFRVLNRDYNLVINQCALGEKHGRTSIDITRLPNIGYNTVVPRLMGNEFRKKTIRIVMNRLDSYIAAHGLTNIALIKVDTEGYEFPILKGLSGYFENTSCRPPIICEINPRAYPLLGHTIAELSKYMDKWNYRACSVFNTQAEVDITKLKETSNVVFVVKA
jgi:FkbM family methyltransferase